ncbi:hypothetical protein V2I01_25660 [Micromonospora sp. BRA006-A]|nr:hypothetical protein [Micromonospora sp. BRA006-A]
MGRLGTLTALYVTQYLGIGFITVGLTAILRDGGTSLDTLALLQVVGLIWPVKFLWAPLLDRYGSRRRGHYRSWLLVLQAVLVLTLLALLPFSRPADQLGPVIAVCAAFVFFSATQDIAVDAVAVRLLAASERAPATASRWRPATWVTCSAAASACWCTTASAGLRRSACWPR